MASFDEFPTRSTKVRASLAGSMDRACYTSAVDIGNQKISEFLETLWGFYAHHARTALPWRQPESAGTFDPYKIMVSELMLQQTQVARVIPKYEAFLARFPDVASLASADQAAVLRAWQGLGYNRRAKFLLQAAQAVQVRGAFPDMSETLVQLPGVGVNTAGAIMAYAYNKPVVFIETNVRTVYIHHFLDDQIDVTDSTIKELVDVTLDREHPREFYWALMDYGSHLKTTVGNRSKASKNYVRQSAFQGSRRQIRGQVLRNLGEKPANLSGLQQIITDERLQGILDDLVGERLIRNDHGTYSL